MMPLNPQAQAFTLEINWKPIQNQSLPHESSLLSPRDHLRTRLSLASIVPNWDQCKTSVSSIHKHSTTPRPSFLSTTIYSFTCFLLHPIKKLQNPQPPSRCNGFNPYGNTIISRTSSPSFTFQFHPSVQQTQTVGKIDFMYVSEITA